MFVARRMKKNIVTVTPSASLFEAQARMRGHTVRQIPVVSDDGTLQGIVSDRDIRAAVLPAGMVPGFTADAAEKFMKNTPVERVMTRKVLGRCRRNACGFIDRLYVSQRHNQPFNCRILLDQCLFTQRFSSSGWRDYNEKSRSIRLCARNECPFDRRSE